MKNIVKVFNENLNQYELHVLVKCMFGSYKILRKKNIKEIDFLMFCCLWKI